MLDDTVERLRTLRTEVLSVEIARLALSVRLRNVLLSGGVRCLADIATLGGSALAGLRGLGARTRTELIAVLQRIILDNVADTHAVSRGPDGASKTGEPHTSGQIGPSEYGEDHSQSQNPPDSSEIEGLPDESSESTGARRRTLVEAIHRAVAQLKPRDAHVLAARLGLRRQPTTLEIIGAELGVSRERARQLEVRALRRVQLLAPEVRSTLQSLFRLYAARTEPIYLDLLPIEVPGVGDLEEHGEFIARLLVRLSGDSLHMWPLHGRAIIARLSEADWSDLLRRIIRSLEQHPDESLAESDVRLLIDSLAMNASAGELSREAYRELQPMLHFAQLTEDPILLEVGRGIRALARATLEASPTALTLSELHAGMIARGGEQVSGVSLQNALRGSGVFILSGRRYGLDRHLPVNSATLTEIAVAAESIVLDGPAEKQWHCAELINHLEDSWPYLPEEVDARIVNAALRKSGRLESLGRLTWRKGRNGAVNTAERHDISNLCVGALVAAGGPLTTEEMAERVQQARGLNSSFLPQPNDRMARIGSGTWGLLDRDFMLTREERYEILDKTHRVLDRRGYAIHCSEVRELVPGCAEHPILKAGIPLYGLAQIDARFRVGKGWLIGLRKWTDMGRPTISAAIRALVNVLHRFEGPEALRREVELAVGRSVTMSNVNSILGAAGTRFDEHRGWYQEEDDDEI